MNVLMMIQFGWTWHYKMFRKEKVFRLLLAGAFILITLNSFAFAQTLDPKDKRLDKEIDFSVNGASMKDVVDLLSIQAGAEMQAGINENDWLVYDRRIIIQSKKMKIRDIMQNIADTMRFSWVIKNNEGKNAYILYQTESQKNDEIRLRSSNALSIDRKNRNEREKLLAEMNKLISSSQTDIELLKTSDPWKYVIATEPIGKNMVAFLDKFPDAKASFISGSLLRTKVSNLTPEQKDAAKQLVESYHALMMSIRQSEDYSKLLTKFEDFTITINSIPAKEGEGVMAESLIGKVILGIKADLIEVPFFDFTSEISRALGNAIIALKSGVDKSIVEKQLQTQLSNMNSLGKLEELDQTYKSDKYYNSKVKLFDTSITTQMPNVLRMFAEKVKVSVFGEYFPAEPAIFISREQTIGEVLQMISSSFDLVGTKEKDVFSFQNKKYFEKRAYEVPSQWIEYWTARGSLQGLLIEDIIRIASQLSDEQLDNTIVRNADLMKMGAGEAVANRYILRLLNQLNSDQVKAIWEGNLIVSSLDEYQWRLLIKALDQIDSSFSKIEKGSQVLKMEEQTSGSIDYTISFIQPNQLPVEFKFTTKVIFGVGG